MRRPLVSGRVAIVVATSAAPSATTSAAMWPGVREQRQRAGGQAGDELDDEEGARPARTPPPGATGDGRRRARGGCPVAVVMTRSHVVSIPSVGRRADDPTRDDVGTAIV